MIARTPAAAGI